MSTSFLLAVHSFPGANMGVERHFPYYQKAGADKILGIGTDDGKCKWPAGVDSVNISANSYINGQHLPRRLVETMRLMLLMPFERFCLIEWDCLFFSPLPVFSGMGGFIAGAQLPGARAKQFVHCPWCWDFDSGMSFVTKADELMKDVSGHECSPDVFFGWVCQEAGLPVSQPWDGFTRNTIESARDAEDARVARLAGAMCIHGVKSRATLDYVMS